MAKAIGKIFLVVGVLVAIFLGYVATREGKFRYERSISIAAPADKIYAIVSDFEQGPRWNPFAQKDPEMKEGFSGPKNQVGSAMEFAGNREAGAGKIEILKLVPSELVELKLYMTKPMRAENLIEYRLVPEGAATRFTWTMSGDGGYVQKLVSVFIDCEKMISAEFEKGLRQLKTLAETPN